MRVLIGAVPIVVLLGCGTSTVSPPAAPIEGPSPAREGPPATPPPAPTLTSVAIHTRPAGGGSASCQFDASGAIHGGHLSGGPSPFVHEDDGRAEPQILASIVRAAEALLVEPRPDAGPTEAEGTTWIELRQSDGTQARFAWPAPGHHPDARVVALEALLLEHRVGGW
jgi:hypothetical protein